MLYDKNIRDLEMPHVISKATLGLNGLVIYSLE